MQIYQVLLYRKLVTEVYLRHVQKIIIGRFSLYRAGSVTKISKIELAKFSQEVLSSKRMQKAFVFCSECVTRWKSWMLNIISFGSKLRKFITRTIFIGLGPYFCTRSLNQRPTTFLPKSRPVYTPINTSFLLKKVSELTLEPKISLSEAKLQKFIIIHC